ncbi:MAG: amidohydrolase family protein, partial [Planctomycetota bacterium]
LRLGLAGIPDAAEDIVIARDLSLTKITRGRLHIGQLSTKGGVALVRKAKSESLNVTAEVTPHHFSLTDDCCETFDSNYKVLPPLREQEDVDALLEGLRDGTIDAIASGHAPHTVEEKTVEFDLAPFGVVGLETLFPASYTVLVERHGFPLLTVVDKLTRQPARILGLDDERGSLEVGKIADVSVFDPCGEFAVSSNQFRSKSRNTCFEGTRFKGKTVHCFVSGVPVVRAGELVER